MRPRIGRTTIGWDGVTQYRDYTGETPLNESSLCQGGNFWAFRAR